MISNIRGERSRIDMTQEQLAERLGVSQSAVRSWENNTSKPGPNQLLAMSDLFGCTVDYLLNRTEERVGLYARPTSS